MHELGTMSLLSVNRKITWLLYACFPTSIKAICSLQTNALAPSFFSHKIHNIFLRIFQNHVIYNVRSNIDNGFLGEVTEWLKVLAWNAGVVKATEGSNPSLTAIIRWTSTDTNILNDGRVPVTVDP